MTSPAPTTLVDARTRVLQEAGLVVGELEESDLDDYVKLVGSAYRGEASKRGWTTEADLLGGQRLDEEMAGDMLAEADSTIILARRASDGLAAGSVYIRQPVEGIAYLGVLAVSPEAQGQGMGSALLSLAEAWTAERWDARFLTMTVIDKREELIAYYVRRGYQPTGRREPFPYGDDRFGLPKVEDLEFIELMKTLR